MYEVRNTTSYLLGKFEDDEIAELSYKEIIEKVSYMYEESMYKRRLKIDECIIEYRVNYRGKPEYLLKGKTSKGFMTYRTIVYITKCNPPPPEKSPRPATPHHASTCPYCGRSTESPKRESPEKLHYSLTQSLRLLQL